MPPKIPPFESVSVTALRRSRGWTQDALATRAGLPRRRLSRIEAGQSAPTPEEMASLTAALGCGPEDVGSVLLGLQGAAPAPEPRTPVDPTPAQRGRIRQTATRVGLATVELLERQVVEHLRTGNARQDRRAAARLWKRLRELPAARRRLLVEKAREFQTWGLAERLAEESARAAAADAKRALELARLAVRVAELSPGPTAWRSRLLGWVTAFLANALRVSSDLPGAAAAFARAWQLWKEGEEAETEGVLLAAWRLPDLEASLRRDQRHWSDALELLDSARLAAPPEAVGRILLNRSSVLVLMGDGEGAVKVLREAAPRVDGRRDPRLLSVLRFNLVANLVLLERYAEAEELLPEVRELAIGLGNEPDLVRTLWLSGQIHAGNGRIEEAEAAFDQVLGEFTGLELAYDAALAGLELSVLYLEQERPAEVRRLARALVWIFDAEGVDEETLKALTVFREAVERETVTAELARQLAANLARARRPTGCPCDA
jgi:transcriptional regulator with XRE-family HTH domain